MICRLGLAVLVMLGTTAHAGTHRIAVIVGNNTGNAGAERLRYAESDAAKLARVLEEIGGVAPDDLFLLAGEPLAALNHALERVRQRTAVFHRDPAARVIVLFYFSGHSDGEVLELGADRLSFSELRRRLIGLGADVRVALVDSCKSGALLVAKGGRPAPGFRIRISDDLESTGEALLTSSAADEVSLESREIGGSFFTHHFVSGLRGAADASGDGRVTLAEVYQYAYAHTLKATGDTVIGVQHPAYDYRLTGQGELVLAELGKQTSALDLPTGFDRIIVIDRALDQVVAEVTADGRTRIAVRQGRYAVRASRGDALFAGEVAVADGETRAVHGEELLPARVAISSRKGDDRRWGVVLVGGGVGTGVADKVGAVPGGRVELAMPSGLVLAAVGGSRAGSGVRESTAAAFAGYRRGLALPNDWSAWGGIEIGAGAVMQSEHQQRAWSGLVGAAAVVGVACELAPRWSLALEGSLPVDVVKRDGNLRAVVLPVGWFAVVVGL